MGKQLEFSSHLTWHADQAPGPRYSRDHVIASGSKPPLLGSADPFFGGDDGRWNPEDLFVTSVAQCHMLWYLYLAREAGLEVVTYEDEPTGVLDLTAEGGEITNIELRPHVTLRTADEQRAASDLHEVAHRRCYLAQSIRCHVSVVPTVLVARAA